MGQYRAGSGSAGPVAGGSPAGRAMMLAKLPVPARLLWHVIGRRHARRAALLGVGLPG